MTACRAIIPVKDLDRAKSRLEPGLCPRERVSLSLEMLSRVLRAAAEAEGVSPLVVSRDSRALALAVTMGAEVLEDWWHGLNASLEGAAGRCMVRGASSILALHADLPMIKPEDISAMMALGRSAPAVVVAPCRRQEGTNALFMQPPGLIRFAFGAGSFKTHLELAYHQGVVPRVYRSSRTALDIDTLEDLELFRTQLSAIEAVSR